MLVLFRDGAPGRQFAMVRTLVRQTATELVLDQYAPQLRFTLPTDPIKAVLRVMSLEVCA